MDLDVALFVYSFFAGAFLLFLTGEWMSQRQQGTVLLATEVLWLF